MTKIFELKKVVKIMLVTILLALALPVASNIVNAEAVKPTEGVASNGSKKLNTSFDKMQSIANRSQEVTDLAIVTATRNLAMNKINSKKIIINGENTTLAWNDSKVLSIEKDGMIFKSISVPVEGEKYSYFSNLTIVFDKNENVVTYSESLITKSKNNKFVISSYIEGNKTSTQQTDLDYVDNSALEEGLVSLKENVRESREVNDRGIGAIAGCIAAIAGINATVAYLIAGTCIAACPAVAPICAACIAGVCTIGAADIAGVIACFNL